MPNIDWTLVGLIGFCGLYCIMEYFNNGGQPPRFRH